MYVVTNREVDNNKSGFNKFGKNANAKGPNELRAAQVIRQQNSWQVKILEDKLDQAEAKKLIEKHKLKLDPTAQHYASLKVACSLVEEARKTKSHILLFVHGFNNDLADVMARAHDIQSRYNVIVLPFSWPADGGGTGTLSYKKDKRDARASAGALERTLMIMHKYLQLLTESQRNELFLKAHKKHPQNAMARDALYAELLDKSCKFTVNAMFHSMGNYLLKHSLKSSVSEGNRLIFDNIALVAADTNSLDHSLWVERLQFRSRCYITINEKDYALAASRAKSGSEQLARLGHFLKHLNAANAHYINFTDASWVRNSHGYFGDPAKKNDDVFEFFNKAFTGAHGEEDLRFHPEGNWYGF
ncbi:MAG: alpha/beta hydrolase [Pseudomonadota bacterium]